MSSFLRIRTAARLHAGGFTLIELIFTIVVFGILISISIPNYTAYKSKALYASIEEQIYFIEQGEELYLAEYGTFFPENGRLDIPRGVGRSIPELGITFLDGHFHRYEIYSLSDEQDGIGYNNLYVIVYADVDLDGDRENDVLISITSYRTTPPTGQVEQQPEPEPKNKKPKKVGKKKPKRQR